MTNTIVRLIGLDSTFCHVQGFLCHLGNRAESVIIRVGGPLALLRLMGPIFKDPHHHQFTQPHRQWLADWNCAVNQLFEKEILACCRGPIKFVN